jgi:hypothetical protein
MAIVRLALVEGLSVDGVCDEFGISPRPEGDAEFDDIWNVVCGHVVGREKIEVVESEGKAFLLLGLSPLQLGGPLGS